MRKQTEINFRDWRGDLVGRKNGMMFLIRTEPGLVDTCEPSYWVSMVPGNGGLTLSTVGHQYFHLNEAKEFCEKIAAGEIDIENLRASYRAKAKAEEQAALLKATEQAKKLYRVLKDLNMSYQSLLTLEGMREDMGEIGHNILLGYERGEGWPSGT